MRILLADDHPINQRLACKQLEKIPCAVSIANNGKEAVDAALRERFDLILMDCYMPIMDGFTATKIIREAEIASGRHTPIIAMTSSTQQEDRDACLAAGMDDYLAKPIVFTELENVLERQIKETVRHEAATLNVDRILTIFKDDYSGIRELLDVSVSAITDDVRMIAEAIEKSDGRETRNGAHALKGAASNIGAERATSLAAAIEQEAMGSCRFLEIRRLFFELIAERDALDASVTSFCSKLPQEDDP